MSPNTIKNEQTQARKEKITLRQHQLHYVSLLIHHLSQLLELTLALLLTAALVISAIQLIPHLFHLAMTEEVMHTFTELLEEIFTLTVGVEALKMLCKHTPGSALEVLIFAMARSVVLNHSDGKYALLGILCITLVFAVRKFLYVHDFDSKPEEGSIFSEVEDDEPLFGHKPSYTKPHQHQMHTDDEEAVSISFLKNLRNDPAFQMGKADRDHPHEEVLYTPIANQND